jgi:predicted acyl esterase
MRIRSLIVPVLAASFLLAVPAAHADPDGPDWYKDAGGTWQEAYIDEADGTKLHADVIRPAGLPANAKTPVILSIGPYFNHSGQVGPAGPIEDAPYEPTAAPGPSRRFQDFVVGSHLLERGYTFVMVDLRSFGGSSGCLDWAGPGEQADVKAAVEWAAAQPWSTGKVGTYGKSYDGLTGLMAEVLNPAGLAAVVSQEPVYDLYRYLYADGVRYENSLATPALYDAIDLTPGSVQDSPDYLTNGSNSTARPGCEVGNWADQQDSDHASDYWKARDFIRRAHDGHTPLFMTQGFIENNTKPDGAWDFFNAVDAPKRAWFGMWDHVRGNDVGTTAETKDRLAMGRHGWFDEVMRFYDHYVKGVSLVDAPTDKDPPIAVETSDGTWRSEAAWPPADAQTVSANLKPGSYTDDTQNNGTGSGSGIGVWTFSPALPYEAHLGGVPTLQASVTASLPNANFVADVYDVDAAGSAILISRQASLVPADGKLSLKLYGDDWRIAAGHRIGVLLTSSNAEWWTAATPTLQSVIVDSASITLPFLTYTRNETIEGGKSIKLESYEKDAPFTVDPATIAAATDPAFPIPPAMVDRPAAAQGASAKRRPAGRRLVASIARNGSRVVVYGTAPSGSKVTVSLLRGSKRTAVRRTTARYNAFRVAFKVRRAGRYRARVSAKVKGRTFSTRTRYAKVRVS